jgi:hypothetical protein
MQITKTDLKQIYLGEAKKIGASVTNKDFEKLYEQLSKSSTSKSKVIKEEFHLGESLEAAKQVGVYTNIEKTKDGNLKLVLTKSGRRFIQNESLESSQNPFSILLGEHFSNSNWKMVKGEEIGQNDSTGPLLSEDYSRSKHGYEYDRVYYYPASSQNVAIQELTTAGSLIFKGIDGE